MAVMMKTRCLLMGGLRYTFVNLIGIGCLMSLWRVLHSLPFFLKHYASR
jgi:hypothetical protein